MKMISLFLLLISAVCNAANGLSGPSGKSIDGSTIFNQPRVDGSPMLYGDHPEEAADAFCKLGGFKRAWNGRPESFDVEMASARMIYTVELALNEAGRPYRKSVVDQTEGWGKLFKIMTGLRLAKVFAEISCGD